CWRSGYSERSRRGQARSCCRRRPIRRVRRCSRGWRCTPASTSAGRSLHCCGRDCRPPTRGPRCAAQHGRCGGCWVPNRVSCSTAATRSGCAAAPTCRSSSATPLPATSPRRSSSAAASCWPTSATTSAGSWPRGPTTQSACRRCARRCPPSA
ncbi:MAG: hypothetical protein AVDCRST_MAG67-298, partial [uncultured Solirubrobacteraceae bacterium]